MKISKKQTALNSQVQKKVRWGLYACLGVLSLIFYVVIPIYPTLPDIGLVDWISGTWDNETDFIHGWAVPFLFIAFCFYAHKQAKQEVGKPSTFALVPVILGILFYLAAMRTMQPRLAFVGLPFVIVGSYAFVQGWHRAKHMLFPAFFLYFAIPVPGIQQATNVLQLFVTKACYSSGLFFGMEIALSGNEIYSTSNSWSAFDIAEGCSGIRSIMALVMFSAIYAYYTQDKLWKKAFLFAMSLPLAMISNYVRVFSILVLAELGFENFAAGFYHDWAVFLFFFPVALAGLFLTDRLLNPKKHIRRIQKRVVE